MSEQRIVTPTMIMEHAIRNPLFENAEQYLEFRKGKFIFGIFKNWFERRAISKCLNGFDDVYTVCDIPCGPGWLSPYWREKGYRVISADLSDPMVEAARKMHQRLNLEGRVIKCNAFTLKNTVKKGEPDLIASVRFLYYFKSTDRIGLLKTMAEVSRKYLLVQYKTVETWRGQKKSKMAYSGKEFCSHREIREELQAAGLDCIRIVPIAQSSDRVFVMAKIPDRS
jgi:predicted TPR repeat methyltransferase